MNIYELWSKLEVGAVLRESPVRGDLLWLVDSWTDCTVQAREAHSGRPRLFTRTELMDYNLFPAAGMKPILEALGLGPGRSFMKEETNG